MHAVFSEGRPYPHWAGQVCPYENLPVGEMTGSLLLPSSSCLEQLALNNNKNPSGFVCVPL